MILEMMIMNKKIIFLTIIVSFFAFFVFTNIAFAQTEVCGNGICELQENSCPQDCGWLLVNMTSSSTVSYNGNVYTVTFLACGYIGSQEAAVLSFYYNNSEETYQVANGQSRTLTNGQIIKINSISCLLNVTNISMISGPDITCTDTDGGINYYVRGQAILSTGANLIDNCPTNSPYTPGKTLLEAYCVNQSPYVVYQQYDCPNGCANGVCLNEPGKPDLKIDKINYYLDDSTNPKKLYYQVTVKNIGTASANFETNVQTPQLSNFNSNTCSYLNPGEACIATGYGYNGLGGTIPDGYYDINAFVDPKSLVDELNESNNQATIRVILNTSGNAKCSDSDGGINYFLKGCASVCSYTSTGGGCGLVCDTCSGNTLTETYCESNQGKTIKYECPSGYTCSEGACAKSTSVCGNGICESSEVSGMNYGQITSCPQDCGSEIEPYDADVKTCTDSDGRVYTIGSNPSAPWFIWGGCAKYKMYNVVKGDNLRFHVYTDSCAGCVCTNPNFDVYEYQNGSWVFSKSVSLPSGKGLNQNEYYTTNSDKIKIVAKSCFYLDVFSPPTSSKEKCVNHDECSQACDNLGISSKWMGSSYNRKSWEGTCPSSVYGCMTGKCCLGQCNQEGNCFCYRTNKVDIYGDVCPEGTTCGDDCECHPTKEEFKFNVKTDKYSYSPGENVRITAILSGDSSINFNEAKVITFVSDNQGTQTEIKMEQVGVSASTCTQSPTGTYTCSIKTEYQFVGNHNIPSNGPIGTWRISSTGVADGNRKNAEINFEVQKVAYDYVDVSINPKEQSTIIGKEVKYDVTITDKHPVMKCYVATPVPVTSATSGGVSIATGGMLASESIASATTPVETKTEIVKCGPQIYNYLIEVGGLPYHTVFPTVVNVHAGGSNTFELKVFPSPAKTAEGITTTVETTTTTAATTIAERTVTITGQPIATQSSATSTQQETTPVKEATFKFAVKVYLKEDQATSDSAIGILHVKFIETPEPPSFPDTEKVNIELNKGWNLVSVPGKGIGFIKGTCSEDKKPVAFVYVLDKQRYVSFEEALNIMGKEKLLEYLSTHSFWIYSYDNCNIGFKFNGYSTYSGLAINRGWNLLGVTKDMMGETLSNIKGSCTFEKIYIWDSSSQKWIEKSENDLISEKENGIIVQTVTDCNLKTNSIQPPPFPGE